MSRLHVQAAVDGPDLADDLGGLADGQEAHDAGEFLGPAGPADRNLSPRIRGYLGTCRKGTLC